MARLQLPITLGFALTKDKVQGTTFDNVVVNLKYHSRGSNATHKRFCFFYVQLSRLRTFAGLDFLQPIDITNFNN